MITTGSRQAPGQEHTLSRRSCWLHMWALPMSVVAAVAAAGAALTAALRFPGWPWQATIIAVLAVVTIGANMWMAWEMTKPLAPVHPARSPDARTPASASAPGPGPVPSTYGGHDQGRSTPPTP